MTYVSAPPAQEEYLERENAPRLFVRAWHPLGTPTAVVVICHGLNSHSGQYFWTAGQLIAKGYAVYALDLRGRGRSDGERFFVESMADYVDDVSALVQFAKRREPGLPVFLLGHSVGGVISATYALDHQTELTGFICESFAFRVYAPDLVLAALKGLSHIAPHLHVFSLNNVDFSRDESIVAAMNTDPLIEKESQPTSTAAALARADERLTDEAGSIRLPILVMHGTADKATKPAGSQLFFDTVGSPDKTMKLYPGYFHDLLNDLGRDAVIEDVLGWIGARVSWPRIAAAAG
ncbi:alpha/beta hydrolase [Mesorhizobium sp. B2-3-3]|uniref:alpha/beta hydrolase n=1 Tax=Mesorhizobium sp. B2-3-5 TaxID=2589958 RepID=UPI00112887A5|nr:alpha/beta hydrolase [Mesorhizobium sp. B2-3-5]TPM24790.1 alpha/beta hydrolase [Mesorhizobium sp. B2-3-5]TPN33609.1 alpha/beta hydrolase [Mesorhizobium sp. B2-3-3]